MIYKLHRIASNSEGWVRPSIGRLEQKGVGDYVKKHGFGHEDWNFNFNMADCGMMRGFTVARPSKKHSEEKFGLVLATYDEGGWRAAGYYNGATFSDRPPSLPRAMVEQMAADIFDLSRRGYAKNDFQNSTISGIEKYIIKDFIDFSWSIDINDVHLFQNSFPIPKNIFNPGHQRMVTSFDIDEYKFKKITEISKDINSNNFYMSVEEGFPKIRIHKISERNQKIVSEFKKRLDSFSCAICGFNFSQKYGDIGENFIECHHVKPISEMKPGDSTKLSDLCAVCSNCHRMLHHSVPMLKPEELRERIQNGTSIR